MLDDLNDFGVVYRPTDDSGRFYPTRLATTLTSSETAAILNNPETSLRSTPGKGYIILETNHRLYAYTSSPLQIAVLNLFARLTTRFPNLVSGKLSRDSVHKAISYGITSDQIISYLASHAHPQMLKSNPILPPTVVDQIRLWQIEGDRMKATPGFLFKSFVSQQEYLDTVTYADNLGVLVWRNDAKQTFFADKLEQLQSYIKNKQMAQTAASNHPRQKASAGGGNGGG
jgi:transcription initiation factor TFIIH subunit 4